MSESEAMDTSASVATFLSSSLNPTWLYRAQKARLLWSAKTATGGSSLLSLTSSLIFPAWITTATVAFPLLCYGSGLCWTSCSWVKSRVPSAISSLMMHILVIVTIIRTFLIFLSRLSAGLNDFKDSIIYPLLNHHLNFFVSTWNGWQLLLFCTIIPLALYPCYWFTIGDGKSLRRAYFFYSRLISDRWLDWQGCFVSFLE